MKAEVPRVQDYTIIRALELGLCNRITIFQSDQKMEYQFAS